MVFQPSIAGLDQAGLIEIAEDILTQRLSGHVARDAMLKDVFVTGGYSLFSGFEERLKVDLRAVVPVDLGVRVRRARDPVLDAWKGAAGWAGRPEAKGGFVSREEWAECGGEYIREHNLGNVY